MRLKQLILSLSTMVSKSSVVNWGLDLNRRDLSSAVTESESGENLPCGDCCYYGGVSDCARCR